MVRFLIEHICKIYVREFHNDYGANSHTDKYEQLFIILQYIYKYIYIHNIDIRKETFASDSRDVSVCFLVTKDIYLITPVYWFTNDMVNTLSPGYLKLFSGFNIIFVELLEYCNFIDHKIKKLSCDTTVKHNMVNLKLKLRKSNQVLGLKPTRENSCTYAPNIVVFVRQAIM